MRKILVDTSVWIDALNGRINPHTAKLTTLTNKVVVCPVIVQEILQGIRSDRDFERVKIDLLGFPLIQLDSLEAAYGAAALYRHLRKNGITIRKSNDFLIAYYCIAFDLVLLHNDEDFNKIARFSKLKILQVGDA